MGYVASEEHVWYVCKIRTISSIYRQQIKRIMIVVKDTEELIELIDQRIKEQGPKCDLNDIDVSRVTDMSYLFKNSLFNGDISQWDVSNVENMEGMFFDTHFAGDISKWDVSNVKNMTCIFEQSRFRGDISK